MKVQIDFTEFHFFTLQVGPDELVTKLQQVKTISIAVRWTI